MDGTSLKVELPGVTWVGGQEGMGRKEPWRRGPYNKCVAQFLRLNKGILGRCEMFMSFWLKVKGREETAQDSCKHRDRRPA